MRVYNTLTRRKEELKPRDEGKVGVYVCGPTVYNHIHVGNARAYIAFDLIRRYLVWRGFEVTYVLNYTDIDDKIIERAHEEGRPTDELAKDYAAAFERVMEQLGVGPPDVLARATDHLDDMISMIEKLIERGFAYEAGGSVWYSVEKFPDYGKLSGRSLEDMRAGERVEPDPNKRYPLDFALWKAAKESGPSWPSPWGEGRPGWHIECSAMSHKYLGMGFDIHGGGSDLIFPHHENEIAQAEAALDASPFVRYWLHNGMVHLEQEKMSKSLGNIVLAKDLLEKVPAQVVRLLALGGHYRSDGNFGDEELEASRRAFEKWSIFETRARELGIPEAEPDEAYLARFREAMDDDFNTPEAISILHEITRSANALLDEDEVQAAAPLRAAFLEIAGVLGVTPSDASGGRPELVSLVVELAIDVREQLRSEGLYEQADSIRARLGELGVILEDKPGGTRWRFKS